MPIFEYQCGDCGAKFEKIVSSSAVEVTCKSCQSPQAEKLLSVFDVAGSSPKTIGSEPGPCGVCSARQQRMCGE